MNATPQELDAVFGPGSGNSPPERALRSTRRFVRGLDLLTFDESPKATGRKLSAIEALEAYGFDKLLEVATDGSAVLTESVEAAGRTLRERRQQLGLDLQAVSRRTQIPIAVLEAMEASKRRPVREYERVARALGLDERLISFRSGGQQTDRLAVRLRSLKDEGAGLSPGTVAALAEAAWVAATQSRLEKALNCRGSTQSISRNSFFGGPNRPPYRIGYQLADQLRSTLGLGQNPIPSMRELVEQRLGIIVIQTQMAPEVAGATVAIGDERAIVLNLVGRNENVYVLRATLAHELCHLLFDPAGDLYELRVDDYQDLQKHPDQIVDRVEARANAFAVQFLAPQSDAIATFQSTPGDSLSAVLDKFGISYTAASFQIWNGLNRSIPFESLRTSRTQPDPAWEGREHYTVSWHPIHALADHPARAGRFSGLVIRAAEEGMISWDSAGEWLATTPADAQAASAGVRELYPDIFPSTSRGGVPSR